MGQKQFALSRALVVAAALLLVTCSSGADSPAKISEPEVSNRLEQQIKALPSSDFLVLKVSMEDRAIRVDILLSPIPASEQDIKRVTLNALYSIQSRIGKEDHLAVWAYAEDRATALGMAFYSSISEQYLFKSAGELSMEE